METHLIHQTENNAWSEQFLKDGGAKFNADCIVVLRLLYKGLRLTAKNVNDMTGMADGGRRLRDIHKFRKDCKKDMRRKADGTGMEGVEYWLEIPPQPSKTALTAQQNLNVVEKTLVKVFELDDDKKETHRYVPQTLFP